MTPIRVADVMGRQIAAACFVAVVLIGCGGGGSSTSSTTPAGGPPPAKLVGTYMTTLKPADIPKPPPDELKGGSSPYHWKLEITKSGGTNNAPTLTIVNPQLGTLESPTLSVSGDMLNLSNEECAKANGGESLVTSAYRWQLQGKTLRLTVTEPGCSDKVAQTILASEPWTRS
jgi:hypothetical protein